MEELEISYKRTHKESYMIVTTEVYDTDYEERMLKENQIRSLLSFYTMEINGRLQFWYDISGKQSLRDYLLQAEISWEILEQLLLYLIMAYEEIRKYLLRAEHICLRPETVYVSRQGQFRIFLCYCPFLTEEQAVFSSIMEYILSVNENSSESVVRGCYEMYEMTLTEGTTLQDLLSYVRTALPEEAHERSGGWDETDKKETDQKSDVYDAVTDFQEHRNYERPFETRETSIEKDEVYRLEPEAVPIAAEDLYTAGKWDYVMEQVRSYGQKLLAMLKRWTKKEEKETIGHTDVLVEPTPRVYEATALLHQSVPSGEGRLVYQGSGEEKDYVIAKETFSIGYEGESNDACLHSSAVSRHHARIERVGQEYFIEDLNSTNGTFVNGELLSYATRYKLAPRDKIIFADVAYLFV